MNKKFTVTNSSQTPDEDKSFITLSGSSLAFNLDNESTEKNIFSN